MHLLLGLLFLLFAAVCSSLDSFTKWKKSDNYNKSKRPCGAATEYELCWQYYKQWRDRVDRPDFRDEIFADMNSYYGVRSRFESPFYLDNEKLMEAWVQTKETSGLSKAAQLRSLISSFWGFRNQSWLSTNSGSRTPSEFCLLHKYEWTS